MTIMVSWSPTFDSPKTNKSGPLDFLLLRREIEHAVIDDLKDIDGSDEYADEFKAFFLENYIPA